MSENSSDSESSCGWTIINHEGSDIETLHSEPGEADLPSEHSTTFVEDLQPDAPAETPGTCIDEDSLSAVENIRSATEEHLLAAEGLSSSGAVSDILHKSTECDNGEGISVDDGHCEAVSDDSDIVTLDPPKADEAGTQGEGEEEEEEEEIPEDAAENNELNMSFSSSSQYTFSQPETVYPSQHSADESSNDEASDDSGPILRRRRSKRSTVSVSESENKPAADQPAQPEPRTQAKTGNNLNKCIILGLVIALSMGFGHFYGTIQIIERQKYVEHVHENELNDMKDDLVQCQKDQDATVDQKVVGKLTEDLEEREDMVLSLEGLMDKIAKENQMLKQKHTELKLDTDDLATSLKTTEVQNSNLALENKHLRESLEKEEQALSSLKEELRKLREQIRNLEENGRHETIQSENQKLKEHLKDERQKIRSFRTQKEALLTEAQFLRKELDNERQITDSLKVELEEISNRRASGVTHEAVKSNQEIEHLKNRLSELEKKLNFEQQRSDLWERLYIESKEQNEKQDGKNPHAHQQSEDSNEGKSTNKQKKKGKATFFNSVKDTFDAVKNSTKEFVRHHKEKIKQAKEAVKENLKKFSDSVKTTFRHFKDSTRSMFDKNRFRKHADRRREETKEAHTARQEFKPGFAKNFPNKATATEHAYKHSQGDHKTEDFKDATNQPLNDDETSKSHQQKGCSDVFECAHQESISLFNKVLDPVRVEEFHDLMKVYLQEQVDHFRHWKELEKFISKFFHNGVFIHDQMLFTDFVNDVEDYLEDMKEYQTNTGGVFEDLDEFIYRHFFGSAYSTPYGPRRPETMPPYKERKQEQKHQAQSKREGKWHKHGRANGRHMANVEIELGQLPFDPKY
ncbi:PREDICTED: cell cycle progression protein 1 [Nanorana parkeri]|uniref:cell cycle progression protein 1 n=1 Tax=Nanorana parkeri TaxID=125878 RepID=UPI0008549958|nr:PREDICTED: cell cycle progression protein 1 [Nanorana parkeri]